MIIQSPSILLLIVNFSDVSVRTVPLLIVHWITAQGLAVAVQLNAAPLGDTTVILVGEAVMTGTTVVNKTDS